MKIKKIAFLCVFLGLCLATFAQEAIWSGQDIISPEIHGDNSVTFRFNAPYANSVEIVGDFLTGEKVQTPLGEMNAPGKESLGKDEKGVWFYTSPPLASEFYKYSFIVDGLSTTDPNNPFLIRDVARVTNVFLIGGGQADLYKVNKVPHGTVAQRWYNSPGNEMERRLTIYTPPGYENSEEKYPTFYLLHGAGGDEKAWIELGRAAQIMDNLIAQGEAKPMIVVMPNGNVSQDAAPGEGSSGFYKPQFMTPGTMDGTYERTFPDIISFVECNYRVKADKADRAIAGLSMGGFHSSQISTEYPDMFDYVGLFSAAVGKQTKESEVYQNFDEKLKIQFSKNPKLYWIAIGNDDFLYEINEDYRKNLDKNQFPYKYYETKEGHIWKNWRIYLTEFVPMLFNSNEIN